MGFRITWTHSLTAHNMGLAKFFYSQSPSFPARFALPKKINMQRQPGVLKIVFHKL